MPTKDATRQSSPDTTTSLRIVRSIGAHPRRALLAVFFFVVLAGVFGAPVAGQLDTGDEFAPMDSDSTRAVEQIEAASGRGSSPDIVLLIDTPTGAESAQDRLDEVAEELAAEPGLIEVIAPGPDGDPSLVSADGRSALVLGILEAGFDDEVVAEGVIDRFDGADDVVAGGPAVAGMQLGSKVGEDLGRAEALALPILILLSLIFFGGRAAVLPLVVGATTVLGTFLTLSGINQLYGLSIFALNLVIGLGLGLSIDYTLFLVTRYREELQRQGPTSGAIATTMRTAGRTVAYSAATVSVALATLTVFPLGFLKSMGIAGATVAAVAAVVSLVVTPAFFGLWGAKLTRRSARRTSSIAADEQTGRWYRLSHAVMRRPGTVAIATALVMLALAVPSVRVNWTPVDSTAIPLDLSARTVSDAIEDDFSGTGGTPVLIAIATAEDDGAAVTAYAEQVGRLDGVQAVRPPLNLDEGTWQLDVAVAGSPDGDTAQRLVAEIRDLDSPFQAQVGGAAAEFVDQQAAIASGLPLALGLLVALTLLLLWLMTGSVVLPVKAVIMNVLTVGSALGVLTFIYQDGRLTSLLGYTPNGGVEPSNFLVTAAIVFALSTDYGVFLLGRIKEIRDAGAGERESVAIGLQRTGSVVTAAAILLAVAIGAFSTSSISFIQQIGVATAFGVLIDAFVVRSLLVPALMGLLGRYNWWAPMSLRRLHDRIGLSEESPASPEPVGAR